MGWCFFSFFINTCPLFHSLVYVVNEREVSNMATKTFEKGTLRIKFSTGVNTQGQMIEKTKAFQNVARDAQLENLAAVGTALASLFEHEWIGTGILMQESIQQ